jgi:hypothetical protein
MLDWWLHFRLHLDWASQAYSRALPTVDVAPLVIGASLIAMALISI